jgi:kinesin family protein C1
MCTLDSCNVMQVRVFCRVKPHANPAVSLGADGVSIRAPGPDHKEQAFTFDRVFGPSISQADVFAEVAELVQSALDGFKVGALPSRSWEVIGGGEV